MAEILVNGHATDSEAEAIDAIATALRRAYERGVSDTRADAAKYRTALRSLAVGVDMLADCPDWLAKDLSAAKRALGEDLMAALVGQQEGR